MGSRWGINRTVGQIYAFLYVFPQPRNADEIGEALGFSRSNVSMGLKELQSWNLVRLNHQPGDRREYFQAPGGRVGDLPHAGQRAPQTRDRPDADHAARRADGAARRADEDRMPRPACSRCTASSS
jgi:DNA-binding transcriptional ArsR family regulator